MSRCPHCGQKECCGADLSPKLDRLVEATKSLLYGTPLDKHGNRDDDGIETAIKMKWTEINDKQLRVLREVEDALRELEGKE